MQYYKSTKIGDKSIIEKVMRVSEEGREDKGRERSYSVTVERVSKAIAFSCSTSLGT